MSLLATAQSTGDHSSAMIRMPIAVGSPARPTTVLVRAQAAAEEDGLSIPIYSVYRAVDDSRVTTARVENYLKDGFVVEGLVGFLVVQ